MRWFKHFTDNHRGQTVQNLINEIGPAGVMAYYFILELCAEKLESGHDLVFIFKRPYFDNIIRMKRQSTDNVLRILSESNVLTSKANHNEVIIEMPILLNLLDRDMKKPRLNRVSSAQNPRLDKELDIDKELDKDSYCSVQPITAARSHPKQTFEFSEFNPVESAKENWLKLYSQEYIAREYVKISNWLIANPKKNKRSTKGWTQFISNWLERGWDQSLKQGINNSANKRETKEDYAKRVSKEFLEMEG